MGSALENCYAKYKKRNSKPQFNPTVIVSQYTEEINPNSVLRGVKVYKIFKTVGTAEDTLDNKNKILGIGKGSTSRPHSPLISEYS